MKIGMEIIETGVQPLKITMTMYTTLANGPIQHWKFSWLSELTNMRELTGWLGQIEKKREWTSPGGRFYFDPVYVWVRTRMYEC